MQKNRYTKVFPKSIKLINYEANINKLQLNKMLKYKENEQECWNVIGRIVNEFQLCYPKLHMQYFNLCSYRGCLI